MNTFWMTFKNQRNIDFDVQVIKRPNIPSPTRRVSYIQIPGRDGSLTQTDDVYDDIEFGVEMNYISPLSGRFMDQTRKVKNWLSGSGPLKFSDDNEVFYKVKNVMINDSIERIQKRAGLFTALFTCDPFTYFEGGTVELTADECKLNPYYLAKPIYHINGTGTCTLTVNGTSSSIPVASNLLIDTDLMVMYQENGTLKSNTAHMPYEKYYLQNGLNSISISNGFTLKIQPNWRSL